MRVAFVTCAGLPDGAPGDRPAAALLGADFRVWDDPAVDWTAYDRVVLRSPWDYTEHVEAFVAWCRAVGAGRLRNVPELVAFNVDKRYLGALACPTVPTAFLAPGEPLQPQPHEIVVKPSVSSGARDTGRFAPAAHADAAALVARIHASGRTALVQPYQPAVEARGETALIFLGGELSHAARKRAILGPDEVAPRAPGESGPAAAMLADDLVVAAQATPAELQAGRGVLDEISARFGMPLYARVDLIPGADGAPLLLELEVVEPDLFMETAPGAAERLAAAVRAC